MAINTGAEQKLDEETYPRVDSSTLQCEIAHVETNTLQGRICRPVLISFYGNGLTVDLVLSRDGKRSNYRSTGSRDRIPELVTKIVD